MKAFRFQQFEISQDNSVFRVGTDAVLLGALADLSYASSALEIGVGTGIISLMLAQRFPNLNILGLEINPKATELAQKNFSNSKFTDRLKVVSADFKKFKSSQKFDVIFSNPPYFEVNPSGKDVLARQKVELSFIELVQSAHALLSEEGCLIVIIPSQDQEELVALCKAQALFLKRKISIRGIVGGDVRRVILEFKKNHHKDSILEEFTIEKSPRQYSGEYLEATKDFHLFKQ